MSFLKKIFSITDYGETHHLLRLFGLKIKFPKSEYAKRKKENPYYYYKKNNVDITTIPPATGQLRDMQLANLTLLNELDYVCRQNNMQYWLDCGTLLGAVRHKGFIPWDDDIDVGMMRADYEKFVMIFNNSSRDNNIYADYHIDRNKNIIIKVMHKKCKHLFVDIFPYDYLGKALSEGERESETNRLKSLISKTKRSVNQNESIDNLRKNYLSVIKNNSYDITSNDLSDIVFGLDYTHSFKNWIFPQKALFQLGEIEFEGNMYKSPNSPKEYLLLMYKNYMSYPKKIGFGHNGYVKLSEEDKEIIDILSKQNNKHEVI